MASLKLNVTCLVCVVVANLLLVSAGGMLGGTGPTKKPDKDVKDLLKQVREDVRKEIQRETNEATNPENFKVISYKLQLVNGINYFIKIQVNPNKYIHLRVYRPFGGTPVLKKIQYDQSRGSALGYFE